MDGEKSKMAAFCLDPAEETAGSISQTFIYHCCFFPYLMYTSKI